MSDADKQPPLKSYQGQFDYTVLSALGGQTAHIQFKGPFQNQEVLWDAHIITLHEIYRQGIAEGKYSKKDTVSLLQFIEINEKDASKLELTVGIDVPNIDTPTVLKTIIMIHNYKRLRLGRHEYGPVHQFPLNL